MVVRRNDRPGRHHRRRHQRAVARARFHARLAGNLQLIGSPPVPPPRGPLSGALVDHLTSARPLPPAPAVDDPFSDDSQLALYVAYELHYRSFSGLADDFEWDPGVLRFRRALERAFLDALRADTPGGDDVGAFVERLLAEPPEAEGEGPTYFLMREGARWQLQEYVAHRSLYHLKEADPQAWAIPRLEGQAKSSFVAVEHDEYGAGQGDRLHARMFARMMEALDLDPSYGAYVDVAPNVTLAVVNAMSLFGLHRSLRGALIGQFASVEITSSPGSARLVRAIKRLNGEDPDGWAFYDEHVEADAVHEQVVRKGVVASLLQDEPALAADIVFGMQADALLNDRLAEHMLEGWRAGQSSLREPGLARERWLVSQNG